jgi:hypothetical protein
MMKRAEDPHLMLLLMLLHDGVLPSVSITMMASMNEPRGIAGALTTPCFAYVQETDCDSQPLFLERTAGR